MPTISLFLRISVILYYTDHPPPHVHAFYQGFEAKVSIETGDVIEGRLPVAGVADCSGVVLSRRRELVDNWERARKQLPLERIPGADVD